jgi:hypothetical protein
MARAIVYNTHCYIKLARVDMNQGTHPDIYNLTQQVWDNEIPRKDRDYGIPSTEHTIAMKYMGIYLLEGTPIHVKQFCWCFFVHVLKLPSGMNLYISMKQGSLFCFVLSCWDLSNRSHLDIFWKFSMSKGCTDLVWFQIVWSYSVEAIDH